MGTNGRQTLRGLGAVAVMVVALTAGALSLASPAGAATCANEPLRTARSAALPDCRAYELVTPENVDGAGGDMLFEEGLDAARVSGDGEHLALDAKAVFFEPAELTGTLAVFSRGAGGWGMRSLVTPGTQSEKFELEVLSPDFSQVGFLSRSGLAQGAPLTFDVGPVGGPYTAAATGIVNPQGFGEGTLDGANAGVPGDVSPFSDVILETEDRELLPPGPERTAAEETLTELPTLYVWSGGRLRLVNVDNNGMLVSPCGAQLGSGESSGNNLGAVSADGARIFFTSPTNPGKAGGCLEPALYMRSGGATVDVSEPEGVSLALSERGLVKFDGASVDGSKVFFTSESALTPSAGAGPYLYEYDVEAPVEHRLTLVAGRVAEAAGRQFANPTVVVSKDGSDVYYVGTGSVEVKEGEQVSVRGFWRYDMMTRASSFVAVPSPGHNAEPEDAYVTPDGAFLMFMSGHEGTRVLGPGGLEVEPRGVGQQQLYRYDAADGSVMCVSCGDGDVAPSRGHMEIPTTQAGGLSLMKLGGAPGGPVDISNDGSRVFFQTSARLVPQDTDEDTPAEEKEGLGRASDVYEWVADGAEDGRGSFCHLANGCTFLISAGEPVGPSRFLGASEDGRNVFFSSAASLVPGAPAGFSSIYDARIGGGFPRTAGPVQCTSCQGVGAPPSQFGTGASETFAGAGNPPVPPPPGPPTSKANPKPKPKPHCRRKYKRNRGGRCVKSARSRARRKP
jgi:hypothetical protein